MAAHGIDRRRLLAGGVALLTAAAVGVWRLVRNRGGVGLAEAAESTSSAQIVVNNPQIFPARSESFFLAVADAIVPRFGPHPAASEIDLLPRLERCIALSPEGPDVFRRHWRAFEGEIRARVALRDGRPDPEALNELLAGWHRDYARQPDPSLAASYFELLRRTVLLAYYTSPAGWASVGYAGPARRAHPAREGRLG